MKTLYQTLILALGALALAGTAYAQVPKTNDTSDGKENTGMGGGALGGPNPTNLTGTFNTASGYFALGANTGGENNTASGARALSENTGGSSNTASGAYALTNNTTGNGNSALGRGALAGNSTGSSNTASGVNTLLSNTTGSNNTASGYETLYSNTGGQVNTATGWNALYSNTTGGYNAAYGGQALNSNTTGSYNAAFGYIALFNNTADFDTAAGVEALFSNTSGTNNAAFGGAALYSNTTGSNNVAAGYQAGYNLTTGSNNIDIGNVGVAGESNLIRIGTKGTHKGAVIAGISTFTVNGNVSAVYVTTTGRLGVLASSERYKTAIAPIGDSTDKLQQLRPVSFHLKADPKGAVQYGLIAEEVAKVYPELVIRGDKGRIEGVRYDELAPMLLNEMQKRNAAQDAEIRDLKQQMAVMSAALQKIQTKDELVAQR